MTEIVVVRRCRPEQFHAEYIGGLVVGPGGNLSHKEFLNARLPSGVIPIHDVAAIKVVEHFYRRQMFDSYGWARRDYENSPFGQKVLARLDEDNIVPYALAWEMVSAPDGDLTLIGADALSNSVLDMGTTRTRLHLVGDPLRSPRPNRVTQVLMEVDNEVCLPLDIVVRLRELSFYPNHRLPVGGTLRVVESLPPDANRVTVVLPMWADLEHVGDWATKPRWVKDDFSVFMTTAALAAQHGPNETFGIILEACKTEHTQTQWFRRGNPTNTAEALAGCEHVYDFAKDVPGRVADMRLEDIKGSPFSWNYPPGSDRRVMTAYTVGDTNWVVLLPAPDWYKRRERAWYLYRAATSALEGILLIDAIEEGD